MNGWNLQIQMEIRCINSRNKQLPSLQVRELGRLCASYTYTACYSAGHCCFLLRIVFTFNLSSVEIQTGFWCCRRSSMMHWKHQTLFKSTGRFLYADVGCSAWRARGLALCCRQKDRLFVGRELAGCTGEHWGNCIVSSVPERPAECCVRSSG